MLIDRSFAEVFRTGAFSRPNPSDATPTTDVRRRTVPGARAVEVTLAAGDQLFTGVSFELSPTEIFVVTSRIVDLGVCVALAIDLPEGEVAARGTVVAVRAPRQKRTPGLSIRLDSIAQADRAALEAFAARSHGLDDAHAESEGENDDTLRDEGAFPRRSA